MNSATLIKDIEEKLIVLSEATEEAKSSQEILDYLAFTSKFHNYSFYNVLSIYFYCPHASHVCGYVAWGKQFGRYVKKGEKGIPILAPCTKKVKPADNVAITTDTTDPKQDTVHKVVGFRVVYVFDISQTDGKPIQEAPITSKGDDKGLLPILEQVTANYNIELYYKELTGSHHGTSYGGRIEVDTRLDAGGKVSVLIHELAHELLHRGEDRKTLSSRQKETEAEATAYIVCSHFGLGTAAANYLALWDIPKEEIVASFQRIHKVAAGLIKDIETLATPQSAV